MLFLEQEKENISKENAKNQALLSSIGDGVVATDEKGLIIWMNQAAEKMLQKTSAVFQTEQQRRIE